MKMLFVPLLFPKNYLILHSFFDPGGNERIRRISDTYYIPRG
jgi:hypothetical protein